MSRESDIRQLAIIASGAKGRKIIELVMGIVQSDLDLLTTRLIAASDPVDVWRYQGGIRALKKLTDLNGSIERAEKPATSEG